MAIPGTQILTRRRDAAEPELMLSILGTGIDIPLESEGWWCCWNRREYHLIETSYGDRFISKELVNRLLRPSEARSLSEKVVAHVDGIWKENAKLLRETWTLEKLRKAAPRLSQTFGKEYPKIFGRLIPQNEFRMWTKAAVEMPELSQRVRDLFGKVQLWMCEEQGEKIGDHATRFYGGGYSICRIYREGQELQYIIANEGRVRSGSEKSVKEAVTISGGSQHHCLTIETNTGVRKFNKDAGLHAEWQGRTSVSPPPLLVAYEEDKCLGIVENCGCDLEDHFLSHMHSKPVSFTRLVEILYDVAAALKPIHDDGFAHLDLKPDNILIDREKTIRLTDLANLMPVGKKVVFERVEGAFHMDPRVLAVDGCIIDTAMDIYSFGSLISQLYRCTRAFSASDKATLPGLDKLYTDCISKSIDIDGVIAQLQALKDAHCG